MQMPVFPFFINVYVLCWYEWIMHVLLLRHSFGWEVYPGDHAPDAPSADVLDGPHVRRQQPVEGRGHRRPRRLTEAIL